jgi:hypothetical protein
MEEFKPLCNGKTTFMRAASQMVAQSSGPRWRSCRELPAFATKHLLNKRSKNANVAPRTELNAAAKPLYAAKNAPQRHGEQGCALDSH